MKKLLILLVLSGSFLALQAQNSTIADYGNKYKVRFDSGDTSTIIKGLFVVENDGGSVRLVSPQDQRPKDHKPFLVLDPTDFGYANANLLDAFLSAVNDPEGLIMRLSAPTDPDSAFHIYGTDTLSIMVFPKNANDSIVGTGMWVPNE